MGAYALIMRGYRNEEDVSEAFVIEPTWWKFGLNKTEDTRFKEEVDGFSTDYIARLSSREVIDIHEKMRGMWRNSFYDHGGWRELLRNKISALDNALYVHREEYSHFVLGFYEWESGM